MAKKRRVYLHVGLNDGHGEIVEHALDHHAHALLELKVKHPVKNREEMLRAVVDLLGTHDEWGYRADEVAGAWDEVLRRSAKGKDTIVVSQPLLATATTAQAARVAAGLEALELHVVVTAAAPDAWTAPTDPSQDLVAVLARWTPLVAAPEHLHVVVSPDPCDVAATWRSFGRVARFGTASLRVDTLPVRTRTPAPAGSLHTDVLQKLGGEWAELLLAGRLDVHGDPEDLVPDAAGTAAAFDAVVTERALGHARQEIDRLTRRNEALELRLSTLERKRAKLKRRLSEIA